MIKITKAVFPVAGLGTRFLPATKANPKEMLPIVDKPLIQYAVEEAIAAGINELIFVTSYAKRAIEDHFDTNYELEAKLAERGQYEVLKVVKEILPPDVTVAYIRQSVQAGLGHAVLCAKRLVGNEPFALLLADDLIDNDSYPCMQQMVQEFHSLQTSLLAVERVAATQTHRYGIVDVQSFRGTLSQVRGIVEKPEPHNARSNLGVVGRYILTPRIFELLEQTLPGKGGEIQLTDAIAGLLQHEKIYTLEFSGQRYDCGSKLGYLHATVAYALKHGELADDFKAILQRYQSEDVHQ